MHSAGCKNVVLTNAAGAINYDYNVGEFMVIEDHLSSFLILPCLVRMKMIWVSGFLPWMRLMIKN